MDIQEIYEILMTGICLWTTNMIWHWCLDWCGSGQGPVAGCYKRENTPLSSEQVENFLNCWGIISCYIHTYKYIYIYGLNVNKAYWYELTYATESITLQIHHTKKSEGDPRCLWLVLGTLPSEPTICMHKFQSICHFLYSSGRKCHKIQISVF